MITAAELRIGNWVAHNEKWNYRQDKKEPFQFQWELSDFMALSECTMEIDNVQPIPLTEEWLLKFGFEKGREGFPKKSWWYRGLLLGQPRKKCELFFRFQRAVKWIETVHQLQNLFYILSGEELLNNE